VIAGAPAQSRDFYSEWIAATDRVHLVEQQTYDLLQHSSAALVTSGTATLETALFGVPQVVCYKAGRLMYQIVKRIIQVPYIAIVNLIMEKEIVKELIQGALNQKQLSENLTLLLKDKRTQENLQQNYELLYQKLGKKGASVRAAQSIVALHKNNTERPATDA
jgi:lipid-A-disaccharide synthase